MGILQTIEAAITGGIRGISYYMHLVLDPVISFAGTIIPGLDDVLDMGMNFAEEVFESVANIGFDIVTMPFNIGEALISGQNPMDAIGSEISELFNTFTDEVGDVVHSGTEMISTAVQFPVNLISGVDIDLYGAPDGKIGKFEQGNVGDCWLLAALIAGLQDADAERIISQSIKPVDGGWEVKLQGMEESVMVTKHDLRKYDLSDSLPGIQRGSYGDRDVNILEIAVDKYKKQRGLGIDEGAYFREGIKLLFNKSTTFIAPEEGAIMEALKKAAADKDGFAMHITVLPGDSLGYLSNIGGGDGGTHSGVVSQIDLEKRQITLVNPWDSGKYMIVSLDAFIKSAVNIEIVLEVSEEI